MNVTRRQFGKLALATAPGIALAESPLLALAQARPNSVIGGVAIGTITYSYRSMPDQSAEATLRYLTQSGISQVELMGGPIESYAGIPTQPAAGGRGGARPGGPGGPGRGAPDPATLTSSWNGIPCAPGGRRGGGAGAPVPGSPLAAAAAPGGAPAPGGGAGRGAQTPEQMAFAESVRKWRTSVSMDKFKALRKMYNDAGVTIYATKMLATNMSDEEMEYVFNVAEALGATHTTLELPAGPTAAAALKRIGDYANRRKIYAAYHTHEQGNMTAFDEAFALSPGNKANIDFGHYVAAGSGDPVRFLEKFHDRIGSYHLKDRTTPANCSQNLAWGTGETPLRNILQSAKRNKYTMPATIELEYNVPDGSDAVKEVAKCLDYCRQCLA